MRVECRLWRHGGITSEAPRPGELTDEHSASSYGLPVLLLGSEPVGPGELPPEHLIALVGVTEEEETAILAAARQAGYRLLADTLEVEP